MYEEEGNNENDDCNLPYSFIPESSSQDTMMLPLCHSLSQKYHVKFGDKHKLSLLWTPLNTPRSLITLLILHWPFL